MPHSLNWQTGYFEDGFLVSRWVCAWAKKTGTMGLMVARQLMGFRDSMKSGCYKTKVRLPFQSPDPNRCNIALVASLLMHMYISRIGQYPFLFAGFLAFAFSLAPSFAQNPVNVEFKREGNAVKELSVGELRRLAPEVSLEVFEVHERQNRVYRVLPVRAVFDKVFGKDWEQAQEVVFTSVDGYQPSVPVKKFLAHHAYFAFANADDAPFTLTNRLQNNEVVPLGPLYLVWDNIGSQALLEAGASDMPYQIKTVEFKFKAPFPKMVPQPGAAPEVQRGFRHFRQHCAACHTINGDGGGKAPELNYPASVVEYIKPEYLKRWILAPQSIRYNTTMPALGEEISNREKVAKEIIAYLKAMSTIKQAPESVKPVERQ